MLTELLPAERFPALTAVIASGAFDDPVVEDTDAEIGFRLEQALDGIACLVEARAHPSQTSP
jgi:hypothetical protein